MNQALAENQSNTAFDAILKFQEGNELSQEELKEIDDFIFKSIVDEIEDKETSRTDIENLHNQLKKALKEYDQKAAKVIFLASLGLSIDESQNLLRQLKIALTRENIEVAGKHFEKSGDSWEKDAFEKTALYLIQDQKISLEELAIDLTSLRDGFQNEVAIAAKPHLK